VVGYFQICIFNLTKSQDVKLIQDNTDPTTSNQEHKILFAVCIYTAQSFAKHYRGVQLARKFSNTSQYVASTEKEGA
jgi:hypothetical protein